MFGLKKRKLKGDMMVVSQYLKECKRDTGVDLFSIVPEDRTRANGWKLCRDPN